MGYVFHDPDSPHFERAYEDAFPPSPAPKHPLLELEWRENNWTPPGKTEPLTSHRADATRWFPALPRWEDCGMLFAVQITRWPQTYHVDLLVEKPTWRALSVRKVAQHAFEAYCVDEAWMNGLREDVLLFAQRVLEATQAQRQPEEPRAGLPPMQPADWSIIRPGMTVAVVGSRIHFWDDPDTAAAWVEQIVARLPQCVILSGGANGVDTWAADAAEGRDLPTRILRPDWATHGQRAGFLRNQQIVNEADVVIAFHVAGSKGTQDTIDKARDKGIPVIVNPTLAAEDDDTNHWREDWIGNV